MRDKELFSFERQGTLNDSTNLAAVIADKAMALFKQNYTWEKGIRSIGVKVSNLIPDDGFRQLTFMPELQKRQQTEQIENTIDTIRHRFGHFAISRGIMLTDTDLSQFDPIAEHTVYPVGFRG